MTLFIVRLFIFVLLPLLIWRFAIWRMPTPVLAAKKWELGLMLLFGIMVGGGGISGFIGHILLSEPVAEAIGWEPGNPFQFEVGFANLAIGILGIIATTRRDGFREATVIAASIFSIGATLVHLWDIAQTGNLAPGNTVQNLSILARPILLIGFLMALRSSERKESGSGAWREPYLQRMALLTIGICTIFSIGYWADMLVLSSALAAMFSIAVIWFIPQGENA